MSAIAGPQDSKRTLQPHPGDHYLQEALPPRGRVSSCIYLLHSSPIAAYLSLECQVPPPMHLVSSPLEAIGAPERQFGGLQTPQVPLGRAMSRAQLEHEVVVGTSSCEGMAEQDVSQRLATQSRPACQVSCLLAIAHVRCPYVQKIIRRARK